MKQSLSHRRYLIGTASVALLLMGPVFILNLLVDPLWYFDGNRLGADNYRFNERVAKLNRLLKHKDDYDCLILGSSRVTLLDETKINLGRCFNLSFSGGGVAEFVAFAEYLKQRGVAPKMVIVGIDGFNFTQKEVVPDLPGFVKEQRGPDSFVRTYLSFSTLGFSLRSLYGSDVTRLLPRYYDAEFICRIKDDAPVYVTEGQIAKYRELQEVFDLGPIESYRQLRELFPEARFIAYVPPVSLWRMLGRDQAGALPGYLQAIYQTSQLFDRVWDFSVPSAITADSRRTYDGSHYDLESNAHIAHTLNGEPSDQGLELTGMSFEAYSIVYYQKLNERRRVAKNFVN